MKEMEIGELKIEVVKKEVKNIHLAVYPKGNIRLTSPRDLKDSTIRLYAISKLSWIKRQQRKFEKQERESYRNYVERESHYLFGKRLLLKLNEAEMPGKVLIKNKTQLQLTIRPGADREKKEKLVEEFYRIELKKRIPELIEKWEKKIGVKVSSWGVKKMTTKWGTCNREAKRIWINLELAKKPLSCLEYIIVHEMVHIIERHHNDKFMSLMTKHLPKWKQLKNELNTSPVSHIDWEY